MESTEILLVVTVVGAGAFAGVIAAMMGVIQRVLNELDYAEYTQVMKGIITSGRKSLVVWGLLLLPIVIGILALISMAGRTETITFGLTLIGLVTFIIGPVLVSRFLNEPWYDLVMTWSRDSAPKHWEQSRMKWFWLNVLRFCIGMLACLFFAFALALYG